MDQTYTVLESNETKNWIKIRVKTGYEVGHDKELVFLPDFKSLAVTAKMEINGTNVEVSTRWNYVDSNNNP